MENQGNENGYKGGKPKPGGGGGQIRRGHGCECTGRKGGEQRLASLCTSRENRGGIDGADMKQMGILEKSRHPEEGTRAV